MHYALRNRYPIESDRQVKTACEYFRKNLSRFAPNERVEAACNIEKRAAELSVPVREDWVTNYSRALKAGSGYSPDFNRSMEMRKQACATHRVQVTLGDKKADAVSLVTGLIEKSASLQPIEALRAIIEFDKLANLEHHYDTTIPDPYMTVFGGYTNPEYDAVKLAGSATNYDLVRASRDKGAMEKVASAFGKGFAAGFAREPLGAIEKLGPIERVALGETLEKKAEDMKYVCPKCGYKNKEGGMCPKCDNTKMVPIKE